MHLLIPSSIVPSYGHEGGLISTVCPCVESPVREEPEESDDGLCEDDPGKRPTKLMVQVVPIEIWGFAVVYGANEKAECIQGKEDDLPY